MAVAVPMACALGGSNLVVPTAGNAGAALALYAATYGARSLILLASGGSEEAAREAVAYGAYVFRTAGDISDAGRIARDLAGMTETFSLATLREPYRVEGKKTMLFEIWEALGGLPDWIVLPTRGAAVAVSDAAMKVSALNLAASEGISACLEGAATLAGFRRFFDDGVITPEDQVVLVNTGSARSSGLPALAAQTVRTADEVRTYLGLTQRAS